MNALVINRSDLKAVVNKQGEGFTYVDRKTYGVMHGLKGAELNRKHLEYRRSIGQDMNKALAATLATGQVVAQKAVPMANGGFKVSFVAASKLEGKSGRKSEPTTAELCAKLGISVEQYEALKGLKA